MKDIRGKIALVTGGAMGMGRLWVEEFLADGAKVVIWDVNEESLRQAEADLKAKGLVYTYMCNVAKRKQVYEVAERVKKEIGEVDILVNNAGIVRASPFLETPDEDFEAVVDVDLMAMFWTMKAFLGDMVKKNRGHIVNISSAAGLIGVPRMAAYCTSKWGVLGLTESVRQEVKLEGKDGIHFTVVCPSYVATGMFEGAKPPLFTNMLKPNAMVKIAYKAFKNDEYIVREPWMVKITPILREILPLPMFDLVSDVLGVTASMTEWKGRG